MTDAARAIAREMAEAAADAPGVRSYEMYVGGDTGHLINLAEYDTPEAWADWITANRPRGTRFREVVDRVSLDVYGTPTPDLAKAIGGYGAASINPRLES
jgi:hypothetical protein